MLPLLLQISISITALIAQKNISQNLDPVSASQHISGGDLVHQHAIIQPKDITNQYNALINRVTRKRSALATAYRQAKTDSARNAVLEQAGRYLEITLINEAFPLWYGTPWDFNGYSNKPQQGQIACGYFVSTPLKHAGFNLNRYDIAKQYSTQIVESLCGIDTTLYNPDSSDLQHYLQTQPNGLFVVGLSNHVGFIHKQNKIYRFIHSNYLGPVAVEAEALFKSDAFLSSQTYVIGRLSSNKNVIRKWLTNAPFTVQAR